MSEFFLTTTLNKKQDFLSEALSCFSLQAEKNPVFKQYITLLGYESYSLNSLCYLPFLPVEMFKRHSIKTGDFRPETTFYSSGTTNQTRAAHPIESVDKYHQIAVEAFKLQYGKPENFAVLGLLPSYLDNPNASLVSMVQHFIELSNYEESGFFLANHEDLANTLKDLEAKAIPTLLIGVSFALIAFAEEYPMTLKHTTVMETGGMKGYRKELVREELHRILKEAFGLQEVHAEYGMTELMSQAYAKKEGIFQPPPWMKVLVRDPYDPFNISTSGKGALNIIDLANTHSCAFLATQDLGTVYDDGSFSVIGRFDNAELRGCNLMVP